MSNGSTQVRPRLLPALAALVAAILIWSSVPLLLKYFTRTLDAWTVNGMRYLFAALFWLPYVLTHRREVPPARHLWKDAWPPALVHVIGQVLFGLTPYFNDATVINFVSRSSFLFVALFGFAMLPDERPLGRHPLFWCGFAGTIAGLIAMYRGGLGTTSTSAFGMILLVVTSAFWGLYSVFVRRFMNGYDVRLGFGAISLFAVPVPLALMFAMGHWQQLAGLHLLQWFLLWLSAVLGIALGHVLFYRAIHSLGPIASEGGLLLIPFATAILAFVALGERLGHLQWLGGFALVLGCLLLVIAKAHVEMRREEPMLTAPND